MKKIILVSVFCFVAIMNGYSQTKQESIKELFHVMKIDSLTSTIFISGIPMMTGQKAIPARDSSLRLQFEKRMKKMIDEDLVTIYDKYFTQSEINDLIRFYKSPTGQKYVNSMPDLQKGLVEIMMKKYKPEIQKQIKAQDEELEKSKKK